MQDDIKRKPRNSKSGRFYGGKTAAQPPKSGHEHKFYAFQVKNEFEPIIVGEETLYRLVSYTYSACGCGVSTRSVSKDVTEESPDGTR